MSNDLCKLKATDGSNEPSIHILCERLTAIHQHVADTDDRLHIVMYGNDIRKSECEQAPNPSCLSDAIDIANKVETLLVDIGSKLRIIESEK